MTFFHLSEIARQHFIPEVLYMVATPIGNLADISARALAGFSCSDVICAEDTRVASRLMNAYGIQANIVNVREHNEQLMSEKICQWLREKKIVLYLSDAGTPAFSDPGAKLAAAVWYAGFRVSVVPGSCAAVAAWSISGANTTQFLFAGFLPTKSVARCKYLSQHKNVDYALICYEAPHRIIACLSDIVETLGAERPIIFTRELTKTFETILRMPAGELLNVVKEDINQQRGEITLIISACNDLRLSVSEKDAQKVLQILMPHVSTKLATQLTAQITGCSKKYSYDLALALRK
jgi:16S rRNA (cytidine1402-2'-O)-methyltransferase